MKKISVAFFFICFGLVSLYGQITIGGSILPNPGSLLDIKENNNVGNVSNTNKGIGMPRVALTSLNNLYPMFNEGYNKEVQDPLHIGLLVYNVTTDTSKKLSEGLYVWDGTVWNATSVADVGVTVSQNTVNIDDSPVSIDVTVSPKTSNLKVTSKGVENSSNYTVTKVSDGQFVMTFSRGTPAGGILDYTLALEDQECVTSLVKVNVIGKPRLDVGTGIILIGENEDFDVPFVKAIGGSEDWELVGFSTNGNEVTWTNVPRKVGENLVFKTAALPSAAARDKIFAGWIDVKHKDNNVITRINVNQSKSYTFIPKSDYMIIRFQALSGSNGKYNDLDGVARIVHTNTPLLEGMAVGYGGKDYVKEPVPAVDFPKNGTSYRAMQYGGDNVTGGFESSLIFTKNLNEVILSDRNVKEFYIDIYATWWCESGYCNFIGPDINLEIDLWVGGEISLNSEKVFINTGGIKVGNTIRKRRSVPNKGHKVGGRPGGYIDNYTPLGRIVFNRETDSVLFLDTIPK